MLKERIKYAHDINLSLPIKRKNDHALSIWGGVNLAKAKFISQSNRSNQLAIHSWNITQIPDGKTLIRAHLAR